MSNRFSEVTIDDVLYHVEMNQFTGDWQVVGSFKVWNHPKHDKYNCACTVTEKEVTHELDLLKGTNAYADREETALRLGILKLRGQIRFTKEQLAGEIEDDDLEFERQAFDHEDLTMDPALAAALKRAEQEKKAEFDRLRALKAARDQEQTEMESSELWGAF